MPREEAPAPYEFKVTVQPPRPVTKLGFSPTEISHLIVSAILVMAVGLSVMLRLLGVGFFYLQPAILIVASVVFVGLFLLHEIAHKLVAQHYGLWAEFRLTLFGALLTLLSVISPFKIISPGAVMIAGIAGRDSVGKTAVAGPLVNIVLSVVSFGLSFAPLGDLSLVLVLSAVFNAFVAVFNLIPVAMLDGLKVLRWSKLVWIGTFIVSLALLIVILFFNPDML